ncbi:lytic transglycosylase catalytic [Escherichia coli]|nr:lytic transglycosylase catalytic [Escherichia coli]
MNAETLKDFLISLGFKVDEAGARKFDAVVAGTTLKAIELGVKVEAAALSVVAFTAKIASGLDDLYWASQRTGATVEGIKQIGYAVSQVGGSVDGARGSLENLARFMRNNPGAEGFLNRLGVQTRDASGNMRDMAAIFTGVGQKLSSMPYYRANQYAQMLGIDENTLMAMRRGVGQFSAQYSEMVKAIGFNADQAALSSNRFMTSLKSLGEMAGMARDKIGSNLADGLAGQIDNLRKKIIENFPKIEVTITKVIKGILWLGEIVGRVAFRIVDGVGDIIEWWGKLDAETKTLIEVIGGLVVAMRILNSTFWMSPIGLITGLIVALGLLWEDYKTWKEGGNSLIDWEKWQPAIDKAKDAITWLRDHLLELKDGVGGWQNALEILGTFIAGVWVSKVLGAFGKISGLPVPPWLKGWMAYAAYLYSDRENIGASAKSSWDYTKQNIGDSLRWLGIDTDFGRNPHTVKGANIQSDIPGAEPEQHAQATKRGERNNNPGNLNFAGQAGASLERPGGRFARFETAFDGLRALARQLMLYAGRGINSVEKIISTWAPASDNNNTTAYIRAVSQRLGVDPRAALNMSDPQTMSALMSSIIQHENGRNIYSRELINKAAVAGISGKVTEVNQQNTYHIYGGGDPHAVGNEVARRQQSANAQVMRSNQVRVG